MDYLGLHTVLYGIKGSDVAAHGLHDECGHFIANISVFYQALLGASRMTDGDTGGLTHRQP